MINSVRDDHHDDSVTSLDLAFLAEDMLSSERRAFVMERLRTNAALVQRLNENGVLPAEICEELTERPITIPVTTSNESTEPHDGLISGSASPGTANTAKKRRRIWPFLISASACAVIISLFTVFQTRSASASALDRLEQQMESGELSLASPETQAMIQELDSFRSHYFVSEAHRHRAAVVMARLYLSQAAREIDHHNISGYREHYSTFAGLRLCEKALAELRPFSVASTATEGIRRALVDSYYQMAQIQYLFGTLAFAHNLSVKEKTHCMYQCGFSLASGLGLLDESRGEFDRTRRLQLAALLARSIHKGAIVGELVALEAGEISQTQIVEQMRDSFPNADLPDYDIDPTNPAFPRFLPQFCEHLLSLRVTNAQQQIAAMEICNALGLHIRLNHGEAREYYSQGVRIFESDASLSENPLALLHYGRLLGNLADNYMLSGELQDAFKWGNRAIDIFRQVAHLDRNSEAIFELGWVTARQLLVSYRLIKKNEGIDERIIFDLLGALRSVSNNLTDFEGFQIQRFEAEWIHAIQAETYNDASLYQGARQTKAIALSSLKRVDYREYPQSVDSWLLQISDFANNRFLKADPDFQTALQVIRDAKAALEEKTRE